MERPRVELGARGLGCPRRNRTRPQLGIHHGPSRAHSLGVLLCSDLSELQRPWQSVDRTTRVSTFCVNAVFNWLSDVEPNVAIRRYLIEHEIQREDYKFECYQFLAWLVRNGYAEDFDIETFHTDSSGCVNRGDEKTERFARWER